MDDLFSSYKGPGLIGMLLGILVLGSFAGLGLAVFDGRFNGEGSMSLDKKVESQDFEIKRLENRLVQLDGSIEQNRKNRILRGEVEVLTKRIKLAKETSEDVSAEIETAKVAVTAVGESREAYRQDYRDAVRARAVGERFDELKTLTGVVYKSAKITSIDALGMSIMHQTGSKRIPFEELPLDMQDLYQFGKEEAAAQQAKEQQVAQADEVRLKKYDKKQEGEREKTAERNKAEERDKIERKIGELERGIQAAHGRIRAEENKAAAARRAHSDAMARGNVSSHLGKAKKAEQRADQLRSQIEAAHNQIAELQRKLR